MIADPALEFWLRHVAADGGIWSRPGIPRTWSSPASFATRTGYRKSSGSPPTPTSRGKRVPHCSPPVIPSSPRPPTGCW